MRPRAGHERLFFVARFFVPTDRHTVKLTGRVGDFEFVPLTKILEVPPARQIAGLRLLFEIIKRILEPASAGKTRVR
jgi:hypothetical protein